MRGKRNSRESRILQRDNIIGHYFEQNKHACDVTRLGWV